uniref:dual specificity protein phosphatase family protein n=1 Tax=Flavobacterium sp. TaxID=239 RepID=UPI00404932CC
MKIFKKILAYTFGIVLLSAVGYYVYKMHFDNNLVVISEGKVYKTAAIPPDEIDEFIEKYKIKTVIDLRMPGTNDTILNPETPGELMLEKMAVAAIPNVQYINIPTPQVPEDHSVDAFIEVMNDSANYPVLIHCHHGTGRACMFSSIYRIEYENFSNEEARKNARFFVPFSSFDNGTPKGEYLKAYKKRRKVKDSGQ